MLPVDLAFGPLPCSRPSDPAGWLIVRSFAPGGHFAGTICPELVAVNAIAANALGANGEDRHEPPAPEIFLTGKRITA
jgi:hypothetical protein